MLHHGYGPNNDKQSSTFVEVLLQYSTGMHQRLMLVLAELSGLSGQAYARPDTWSVFLALRLTGVQVW